MAAEPLLPVVDPGISDALAQEATNLGITGFVQKYLGIIEEENPDIREMMRVMVDGEPPKVRSLIYVAMISQYVALRSQAEADRLSREFFLSEDNE